MEQALEALNAIPLAFMNTHDDVANMRKARVNIAAALAESTPVQEPVSWGVDWGSHGDRSCVSIVKQHANGTLEVIATEYGPAGSAPQAQHQRGV